VPQQARILWDFSPPVKKKITLMLKKTEKICVCWHLRPAFRITQAMEKCTSRCFRLLTISVKILD
jgi:hypothetical protein